MFCHTNPWIMIAAAMTGDGDAAFDYYKRINPSAREAISDLHRCEPYVYAQMIAGRDAATHGEAKNSWLTGTAAWNYVAITQWICGIRPELDGLRIDPVLPAVLAGLHRHPPLPRRDLPDHRPPRGHPRLRPGRGRRRASSTASRSPAPCCRSPRRARRSTSRSSSPHSPLPVRPAPLPTRQAGRAGPVCAMAGRLCLCGTRSAGSNRAFPALHARREARVTLSADSRVKGGAR